MVKIDTLFLTDRSDKANKTVRKSFCSFDCLLLKILYFFVSSVSCNWLDFLALFFDAQDLLLFQNIKQSCRKPYTQVSTVFVSLEFTWDGNSVIQEPKNYWYDISMNPFLNKSS